MVFMMDSEVASSSRATQASAMSSVARADDVDAEDFVVFRVDDVFHETVGVAMILPFEFAVKRNLPTFTS
jgi:hypothetical protein